MNTTTEEEEASLSGDAAAAAPPASTPFDVRLISEYDGTADVVEWVTRAEMLCQLRGVPFESVLPLRLTGGAFTVWSQLPDASRCSSTAICDALYTAFALDQYAAYETFVARRLRSNESADVYLADLRRLSVLFGGIPERALACAFVAGMPDDVRRTIRAGCRAEDLDLTSVLARARAVLTDERVGAGAATSRADYPTTLRDQSSPPSRDKLPERQSMGTRRLRRCWNCGQPGHLAAACPRTGNDAGGDALAPASSSGNL